MSAPIHSSTLSFNSGELTPYLAYRTDFAKHASGVAVMENFLPMPFGGFRKRPGTLYLTTLSAATRLEPFYVSGFVAVAPPTIPPFTGQIADESDGKALLLAFSTTQLKVYDTQGNLIQTLSLATANPFLIQTAQVNNVMFLTAPDFPPKRLSLAFGTTTFTLEDVPFSYPPLLDENPTSTLTVTSTHTYGTAWTSGTVYAVGDRVNVVGVGDYNCTVAHTAASGSKPTSGLTWASFWKVADDNASTIGQTVTLTASSALWTSAHVGSVWRISKKRPADLFETEIEATSGNNGLSSKSIPILGGWTFNTFGTWDGTFIIQRSTDNGVTWTDYRQYKGEKNRNVAAEGTEDTRVLLRVKWIYGAAGSSSPKGVLSSTDAFIPGLVRITAYSSSTSVTATTLSPVEKTTTEFWTEGAFSAAQGYPVAVALHERRLCFAGTTKSPASIWLSKTDDLLNFTAGTDADSSIFVTLAGTRQDPIKWLASQRRLFVGTSGGEWVFGSETTDSPLAPDNLLAREYTRFGSTDLPAITHHDSIFFVERQGRRLREMAYQLQSESYDAADLTRLAEHITEYGITQMAWQQNREPYLWAVRGDGTLISFNYNRTEQIAAWARHTTYAGQFTSVAILRNARDDDSVFFVVKRGSTYYLERMASQQQAVQERSARDRDFHGVDCGLAGTFSSLALPAIHRGTTVTICREGYSGTAACHASTGALSSATVPAGAFYDACHAGFPITATITTLPLDITGQNGTSHFRKKRANEIVVRLFNSADGELAYNGQTAPLNYSTKIDPDGSGQLEQTLPAGHVDDLTFTLSHSAATPFAVIATVLRWSLHES